MSDWLMPAIVALVIAGFLWTTLKTNKSGKAHQKRQIEITQEFKTAIEAIKGGNPVVLLTGSAGTGKTTFIDIFRKNNSNKNIATVSFTGVAALNAGGKTIHSFFGLPPKYISEEAVKELSETQKSVLQKLDILIIDEISMVRADLMDGIDMSLRLNAKEQKQNIPFAGVQIVMVGDLFQLPPVMKRTSPETKLVNMHYPTPYFLGAKTFQGINITRIELTKCFRQEEDRAFFEILQNVRTGKNIEWCLAEINKNCLREPLPDSTTLTFTKAQADKVNRENYIRITAEERIYTGQFWWNNAEEMGNIKESDLPSPINLKLKIGTLVMFTKNDHEERWVNGTTGKIVGLGNNSVLVRISKDRPPYEVGPAKWVSYEYTYSKQKDSLESRERMAYEQLPLIHAWAITVHKAQGRTIQKLHLDSGDGAFEKGQVYVALSRCPTMRGLSIKKPLTVKDIQVCPTMQRLHKVWQGKTKVPAWPLFG